MRHFRLNDLSKIICTRKNHFCLKCYDVIVKSDYFDLLMEIEKDRNNLRTCFFQFPSDGQHDPDLL